MNQKRATSVGFGAVVIFAIGTLIYALSGSIPPFQFLGMSFTIAGLVMMSFYKLRGEKIMAHIKKSISVYALVIIGVGLHNAALLLAFRNAPAFEVNTLNYLWPILIVLFSAVVNKTHLGMFSILGMICGFTGMLLLFMPEANQPYFSSFSVGHVLAIIGALSWAIYSAIRKKHIETNAVFLGFNILLMGVIFSGVHFSIEQTVMPSLMMWGVILLFAVSCFCYVMWDYAMQKGDQIMVAAASYFTPILSTMLFIAFGLKPQNAYIGIAGGLIVLGCVIVNMPKILHVLRRMKK